VLARAELQMELNGNSDAANMLAGRCSAESRILPAMLEILTFSTTPVVCFTLAKWETESGQFGGYLTLSRRAIGLTCNCSYFLSRSGDIDLK
jgi:hypothetical protein